MCACACARHYDARARFHLYLCVPVVAARTCADAAGELSLSASQLLLQYLIDAAFLADIAVRFRTMYVSGPTEGNELITDPRRIAAHYTRGTPTSTFLLDLCASLPIDLLALFAPGGVGGLTGQALRLNRLAHVWRVRTVHWEELMKLARLRRLLLLWLVFLLLAHCIACCWWALGNAQFNLRAVTGREPWPHPSRMLASGRAVAPLDPSVASLSMRYWTCMYWALTTMTKVRTHMGPRLPHTLSLTCSPAACMPMCHL